ncbi:hypothetical protein SDC9_126649 [bioreactor metagenome]|uniref:HTH-like domain-containing protein n=1 Tax=bioreactor metagenome TaxID=1076179 RepID=A0A645CR89_9ZZZZ
MMCRVLNIPRSTYYKAHDLSQSNRSLENKSYEEQILSIYEDGNKRYGALKIHRVLLNNGVSISIKRVQRLMKKLGIRSIVCIKLKPYSSDSEI